MQYGLCPMNPPPKIPVLRLSFSSENQFYREDLFNSLTNTVHPADPGHLCPWPSTVRSRLQLCHVAHFVAVLYLKDY